MFECPEHSLRELVQFSPLAIEELDPESKVKLWNPAAEQMFGWRESEVLGRAYPAIPAESRAEFEDEVLQVLGGATIRGKEVRRQCKDGRQFDARLWAAPIHDQRNQIIGITKILEDITDQKENERKLRLSLRHEEEVAASVQRGEERMRLAFEVAKIGFWDWNIVTGEIVWPALEGTQLGVLVEDSPANFATFMNVVHPDDRKAMQESLEIAIRDKGDHVIEYRVLWPDGRVHWRRAKAHAFYDERGRPVRMVGIAVDIDDRVAADERLLLQAAALEAAANSIVITDKQGTILWANQAFSQLTGYSSDEVLGKNPRFLKSGEQDSGFYTNLWATVTSAKVWHGEVVNRKKDGSLYTEEMTITPMNTGTGEISHYVAVKQDLTWRKVADEALRQAEMQYRLLFESNPLPMWVFDCKTLKFLAVNEAAIRHYGFSRQEFLAMTIADIRPEEDISALLRATAQPIHGLQEAALWRHRKKDGTIIDVEIVSHELAFHGIQAELVAPRDVTERKKAEKALRRSEAYLAFAQGISGVGSWVWDPSTREIFYWSEENYRIWDIEGAVSFEKAMERIHPEDRPVHAQAVEKAIREKTNFELDFRLILGNGSIRYIHSIARQRISDRNGQVEWIGAHIDVTERERAQAALRQSEERYEALFDRSLDCVYLVDFEGHFLDANPAALDLLGYRLEDFVMLTFESLLTEDQVATARKTVDEILATGRQQNLTEYRLRGKDGRYIFVETQASLIERDGKPIAIQGIARDVTERKQAEAALHLSQERLRLAVRVAAMGIWEMQFSTRTLIWAPEVTDIFGIPADAPQPSFEDAARFTHPEDRSLVEEQFDLLLAGKPIQLGHRIIRPDGTVRWIEVTAQAEFDASGQPVRSIGVIRDVTERHQLEERFRQAQKMEAVGRLSGGVAHDFNNILMIITGYGDLLKEEVGINERVRPMIEAILKAANRAASLTQQLLAFSRKQIVAPKVLDLNSVLADLGKMLPRLIGEDIDLEIVPGNRLGRVMADASQIQQVIMNLVVNARDAMPDGGRLTIATANAEWDEKSGREYGMEAKPGSFVLLSVADNGIGMDREIRAHLFEPFFTTKGVDKGTGLGLSIVYGVVNQSGGFISVDSELGEGTTFKIYLPRIEEKETIISATRVPSKSHRGSETILLVEDEQGVREAISHFLQGQGYTVLEAHNPSVAIEIAREQSKRIHLLMTDMIMPEMNGRELARQLTATRPEMSVLYISGYTDRGTAGGTTIDSNIHFLQKPFGFDVLGRKLRDILDR